jgi:hypothetical protein
MAIISNDFNPTQAPAGIFYPQDYSLEKLNFINSNGQTFNMKNAMVEMSYYEDIYSFCVSGSLTVRDAQGFIELFQLSGSEYMEINFGKVKGASNSDDQRFHVYKIGKRVPTGNMNDEFYTIYFCSEELYLSEQLKISKSYTGQKVSSIISSILTNTLKVQSSKINVIEDTTGVYDFLIPRFKPLEAISWLSTYARHFKNKGSDMLFYQNRYGYNFRSLQSIYQDKVYATYKYQQKNLTKENESAQDKAATVLDYEFIKTYDILGDTASGAYSNQLISLDPVTRKSRITNFDYTKYKSDATSLNGKGVLNPAPNRLGTTQNQNYGAVTKVLISNANQGQTPYIKQVPGSVAKDIFAETYIPNRTAQLSLANYTVMKLMIPGDPGITAGAIINFNLLSLKPTDKNKGMDKFYSGKYLVTAVRHVLNDGGSYITILEIAKDSNKTPLNAVNTSSTEFAKSVKA